ncbi:thioredoxin domain-containing protein [Flavobacteriaceae bacterium]|nr:thioredoxin domain-containing protein [Flavobacteriaceae bacterium]
MNFKMGNTSKVKFYVLILALIYSCSSEVNTNSVNKNQLNKETSLYLKQHSENPINWQRWSNSIFDVSQELDKLLVISIGYSSCHWCHVMEEETFTNDSIAKVMNANFINIKVDREENPDVDQAYMTASQLMTGMGGWPLNVITLPDGSPIYAGTYHTTSQWNDILKRIVRLKEDNYDGLKEIAANVKNGVKDVNTIQKQEEISDFNSEFLNSNIEDWTERWDLEFGGDIAQQKFVSPSKYLFLLNYGRIYKDEKVLNHVKNTLDVIASSGLNDFIEGGFYRYTVDNEWKIPHFEKMLYDQAQMISLFSMGYKVFGDQSYKDIVSNTILFLSNKMSSTDGLYYAAMDADTDGEEGKYYSYEMDELKMISENTDFDLFLSYYNIDVENPWEKNRFLLLPNKFNYEKKWIDSNNVSKKEISDLITIWEKNINDIKEDRTKPRIDDKIIVSWNALAIIGLIDAYDAFKNEDYIRLAKSMFKELKDNSYRKGKLIHTYKENQFQEGVLEDYAYLSKAAMRLFQATGNISYFDFSKKVIDNALELFNDEQSDLLKYSNNEELFTKVISIDDGVTPSPNSIIAEQLFSIGHVIFDDEYLDLSDKMVSAVQKIIDGNINSYSVWANNILNRVESFYEIAVIGPNAKSITDEITKNFTPNTIVVQSNIESKIPLFIDRFFEDETYIYVCQNKTCQRPETNIKLALEQVPYIN